jgi:hypothetical protein
LTGSWITPSQSYPATEELLNVLGGCIEVPAGVDPQDFFNCVECYAYDNSTFNPEQCAADLESNIVEPLRNAEAVLEHDTMTRLTSSVSPDEMTLDPMFVVNHDMGDVSQEHRSDLTYRCENGEDWYTALRELELADGRIIVVPSEEWFADNDMTYGELIETLTTHNALIIEETSAQGQPEVIFDLNDEVDEEIGNFNDDVLAASGMGDDEDSNDKGGCGCNAGTLPAAGGLWLLGALSLVARRRS